MHKTVLLHHTLPDGSSHIDWLIDQPKLRCEHRLLAWRCACRPDQLDLANLEPAIFIMLPDHRAHYLTYEGPISQNRGSVTRLAVGSVLDLCIDAKKISVLVHWPSGVIEYEGQKDAAQANHWHFVGCKPNSLLDG